MCYDTNIQKEVTKKTHKEVSVMRVKAGWIVKVADIGTPAKVVSAGDGKAELEFDFPEGREVCMGPYSVIASVLSRGEAA